MNWSDIGKLIKPLAPTVGTLLGGPLGGLIGAALGGVLGLGGSDSPSPITPETVQAAIAKGGDVIIASITSFEEEAKARWGYLVEGVKADAAQGQAINETMRAEVAAGVSWWHWRHLMGYCLLPWMVVPLPTIAVALYRGDGTTVQSIINLSAALLPYLTIFAALLGYVAADTTRRTTTAIVGDHAPTILGTIAKAIGKK